MTIRRLLLFKKMVVVSLSSVLAVVLLACHPQQPLDQNADVSSAALIFERHRAAWFAEYPAIELAGFAKVKWRANSAASPFEYDQAELDWRVQLTAQTLTWQWLDGNQEPFVQMQWQRSLSEPDEAMVQTLWIDPPGRQAAYWYSGTVRQWSVALYEVPRSMWLESMLLAWSEVAEMMLKWPVPHTVSLSDSASTTDEWELGFSRVQLTVPLSSQDQLTASWQFMWDPNHAVPYTKLVLGVPPEQNILQTDVALPQLDGLNILDHILISAQTRFFPCVWMEEAEQALAEPAAMVVDWEVTAAREISPYERIQISGAQRKLVTLANSSELDAVQDRLDKVLPKLLGANCYY